MKITASRMVGWSFVLILSVAARADELPQARPEEVGISPAKLARAESVVQELVDKQEFAGAVTVVARKGKIVEWKAAGLMDIDKNRPMQTDTIFRIYSMTKPITTVAAMMLWEEGKFQLDDPVSKYIPEFKELRVYKGPGDETEPARSRDHDPRPDAAHLGADLWSLRRYARSTRCTRRTAARQEPAAVGIRHAARHDSPAVSAGDAVPLQRLDRRPGPRWSRSCRASRSTCSLPNASSSRSTWSTRAFTCRRRRSIASTTNYGPAERRLKVIDDPDEKPLFEDRQVLLGRRRPGLDGPRLHPFLPDAAQRRRIAGDETAEGSNRRRDDPQSAASGSPADHDARPET